MFEKFKDRIAMKSDPASPRYRRYMANRICGLRIKYVTERINDVETVIGRAGGMNIRDGVFIVHASNNIVFRANVDEMSAGELLSHDGVVLTAPDLETGRERTIVVHFTDYFR